MTILILILLGSTQLMSAVPVMLRAYFLRRWLAGPAAGFLERETHAQLQVELRALRKLRYVAVAYFAAHVGGAGLLLALYNAWARDDGQLAAAIRARGVSPWFAGFFLSVRARPSDQHGAACVSSRGMIALTLQLQLSLFANAGFSLFTDSFTIYQRSAWPLVLGAYLILAGNTAYPVVLRGCIVRTAFRSSRTDFWFRSASALS